MIPKFEILALAREWQLRPEVVEKDYVLGWVLAAFSTDPETSANWILKGGTCLKKCFVETYRFSEDLDFSLTPEAGYTEAQIHALLVRVSRTVRDTSGIEVQTDLLVVKQRQDTLGRITFEARIPYRGPLAIPGDPRLRLDITQHEAIVDEPDRRSILHPYPDQLPPGTAVLTYTLEEVLAEKTRALFERSRPRDLYDVVYMASNLQEFDRERAREVWMEKCRNKGIAAPTRSQLITLVSESAELRADWASMISHQLPHPADVEAFIARLPEALLWLDALAPAAPALPRLAHNAGEATITAASVSMGGHGLPLEVIRFAGANRVKISFDYSGKQRVVEPYSLRRAATGNLLLYGWEDGARIKAFNVDRMANVGTTTQAFTPRYAVELSSIVVSPSGGRRSRLRPTGVWRRPRASRSTPRGGRTYVFKCVTCGKELRRKKNKSTLRRHTYPNSSALCPSRVGYLVRVT